MQWNVPSLKSLHIKVIYYLEVLNTVSTTFKKFSKTENKTGLNFKIFDFIVQNVIFSWSFHFFTPILLYVNFLTLKNSKTFSSVLASLDLLIYLYRNLCLHFVYVWFTLVVLNNWSSTRQASYMYRKYLNIGIKTC